jgi:hypothetical protein
VHFATRNIIAGAAPEGNGAAEPATVTAALAAMPPPSVV